MYPAYICIFLYESADNNTTTATVKKNSRFILSERSEFYMVNNLSIVVNTVPMYMLTSLSIDEILLPRYMNWSTNFKSLLFNKEMAPS